MRTSEIVVSQEAVDALVRMGDLPANGQHEWLQPRPDGRFNLRVSESLRQKLDRILVNAGRGSHSDAIIVIERLTREVATHESE